MIYRRITHIVSSYFVSKHKALHLKMASFAKLQNILRMVLISFFILKSHSCILSSREFGFEPSDKLAYKGDFVNLSCIVHGYDPLSDSIEWKSQPDMNNTNVIEKYYEKTRDVVSVLTVQARISVQYFTCQRIYSKYNLCFSSRRATLKVQFSRHFPDENDLKCGPQNPEPLHEGDILHTFCKVPRGEPPVDMNWRLEPNVPMVSLPLHRDEAFQRVLTHELPVTQELHNRMIVCEVTSEIVFPGRRLQCLIGPILVTQPPTVFVLPANAEVSHGLTVEFTCVAHGFPDQFIFSWSCSPDGVFTGCMSTSKTANISLGRHLDLPDSNDVRARVECTVSNGLEQASGFSTVELLPTGTTPQTLSKTTSQSSFCSDDISVNVTIQNAGETRPDSKDRIISCSIGNKTQQDVQFYWYVGDNKIQRDNPNAVIEEISPIASQLRVLDLTLEDFKKPVICVVKSTLCITSYNGFVSLRESLVNESKRNNDLFTLYDQLKITHPGPLTALEGLSTSSPVLSINSSKLAILFTAVSMVREPTSDLSISLLSHQDIPNQDGWQIITFALLGSLGIVIIVSCIVTFILVTMYRYLKRENLRNINSFRAELKTSYRASKNDLNSYNDHIYDVARFEYEIKFSDPTFVPKSTSEIPISMKHNDMSDSSDTYSSYTSSAENSWSASSGIYLDPNPDINSPKQNLDVGFDMNMYGNENVIQMHVNKTNRFCRSTAENCSITKQKEFQKGSEMPMPPFPLKNDKTF